MRKHQQLDDDIHGQFDSSGSFFGGTHISGKLHVVRNILHHTKIMRKIVKANACVCVCSVPCWLDQVFPKILPLYIFCCHESHVHVAGTFPNDFPHLNPPGT